MDVEILNNTLVDLYGTTIGTKMARSRPKSPLRGKSAPSQGNILAPTIISGELTTRRCSSDVSLGNNRSSSLSSGLSNNYYSRFSMPRRVATMLLSQRSNAQGVKDLIVTIEQRTMAVNTSLEIAASASVSASISHPFDSRVPDQECSVLAQVAQDAYYRVVIGSSNGVAVLIHAMNCFPHEASLQEACCQALGNLCEKNGSNQLAVQKEDGIKAIVTAMRHHPSSIAVQSAACETLRVLSSLILTHASVPHKPSPLLNDVIQLVQHATDMYITPTTKESAEQLLSVLTENAIIEEQYVS